MNRVTTTYKVLEDDLLGQGFNPDIVFPILEHGLWVVQGSEPRRQTRIITRELPTHGELGEFVAHLRPLKIWMTGECGNMATAFRETNRFVQHLLPPDEARSYTKTDPGYGGPEERELDVRNRRTVQSWIDLARPDLVIHNAAIVGSERVASNRQLAEDVNVGGTEVVANACHDRQIPLIYLSSTAIYDITAEQPYTEESPVNPHTLYGQTKVRGEEIVRKIYADTPGLAMVVRPCFNYGRPYDRQSQLARYVRYAIAGESEMSVTLAPENEKDWMRIEDTARGLELLTRVLFYHPNSPRVVNIALGEAKPAVEYFQQVAEGLYDVELTPPNVMWLPETDYLGSHRVSSDLLRSWGWKPKYSDLWGFLNGTEKLVGEIISGPYRELAFDAARAR